MTDAPASDIRAEPIQEDRLVVVHKTADGLRVFIRCDEIISVEEVKGGSILMVGPRADTLRVSNHVDDVVDSMVTCMEMDK